jgi:putative membrane protein
LASQKKVTLPSDLDQKHRAMQERLAKLKGAPFDKAYMAHMVTAHQQAVTVFQQEAKGGKDPDVKAWAAKTLPVLQEHYKMARRIDATVGTSGQ